MPAQHPPQSFANHSRFDPPFHYVAAPLIVFMVVLSLPLAFYTLLAQISVVSVLSAVWMVGMSVAMMMALGFSRINALKVQDRVIAIEVERRYERLGGTKTSPLAERLEPGQLVALRFASDGELVALADRAAAESMKSADIKRAITSWRADHRRV
jgi:Family of unknown function (DUF6526)